MAEKCTKCNEDIVASKDPFKCSECSESYHPGCCRIKTSDAWRKLGAKKASWRCDVCASEASSQQSRSDTDTSETAAILATLQALRRDIADNQKESRKRFDNIEEQIRGFQQSIDENRANIKSLEVKNIQLNELCEATKAENENNAEEVKKLRLEVLELQQYSRRNNIEIKGIPVTQGENIYYVLEMICKALNIPWSRSDVSVAHRLPQRRAVQPTIIVAFVSRSTKEAWLSAARKKKLTTPDISPQLHPGPVYINSHLTGHNKQLLGFAKKLVREQKLTAAWATDGKVLIRRTEGGRAARVFVLEDLDNV